MTTETERARKMAERKAERAASEARMAAQREEASKALKCGCPRCGRPVKLNLSLTGWVQCEQYGAEGFRKDASAPACGWQGFYR